MRRYFLSTLAFGLVLISCGRKEEPKIQTPAPSPVLQIVATVSFIKGQAKAFVKDSWQPAAMQMELADGDSLDIPAQVSLELKDKAGEVVKLSGPARGTVASLMSGAAPKAGTVSKAVDKIKKLNNTEQKFQTSTPTAVAGIRGAPGRKPTADTTKSDSLHK